MSIFSRRFLWCALLLSGILPLAVHGAIVPEAPPVLVFNNVWMAPIRPLAEIAGATVITNANDVIVIRDGHYFSFNLYRAKAQVDGKEIDMPLKPFINEQTGYVPLETTVTALGGSLAPGQSPDGQLVTFPGVPPFEVTVAGRADAPQKMQRVSPDILLIAADCSGVQQLSYDCFKPSSIGKISPQFTPDGKSLIYMKGSDIYQRKMDSPTAVMLSQAADGNGLIRGLPVFSPDGSLFYVQSIMPQAGDPPGKPLLPELCRVNADGSGFKSFGNGVWPQFSTDGKLIAYTVLDTAKRSVHVMNSDGTGDKEFGEGLLMGMKGDGSALYYMKMNKDDQQNPWSLIGVTVADGKEIEQKDKTPLLVMSVKFTPDGKLLYIPREGGLWTMDPDFSNRKQLTEGPDHDPVYVNGGKEIIFLRGYDLCIMKADGSEVRPLAPSHMVYEFSVSPDGTKIVAAGIRKMLPPQPRAIGKHDPPTDPEIAAAKKAGTRKAIIKTKKGDITVELYGGLVPMTVANFVKLAKSGFYKNTTFHRVVPDFVIQGGDPQGNGSGDPGYSIKMERSPKLKHGIGMLAMARSQEIDSAGCQFYICLSDNESVKNLDNPESPYAVFGKVIKGMDVVKQITQDDAITNISIEDSKLIIDRKPVKPTSTKPGKTVKPVKGK